MNWSMAPGSFREAIEDRVDLVKSLAAKRKKNIAQNRFDVVTSAKKGARDYNKALKHPFDLELFIAITIFELAAILVPLRLTPRLWPRIAGAVLVALTAAIARNVFYGPGVNRETLMMSSIHAATVAVIFALVFLVRWKRRK